MEYKQQEIYRQKLQRESQEIQIELKFSRSNFDNQ